MISFIVLLLTLLVSKQNQKDFLLDIKLLDLVRQTIYVLRTRCCFSRHEHTWACRNRGSPEKTPFYFSPSQVPQQQGYSLAPSSASSKCIYRTKCNSMWTQHRAITFQCMSHVQQSGHLMQSHGCFKSWILFCCSQSERGTSCGHKVRL